MILIKKIFIAFLCPIKVNQKLTPFFETCVLRLPIKIFQLSKAETFPSFSYIRFSLKTFHQFYFKTFKTDFL